MKKTIAFILAVLFISTMLFPCALAAPPSITILPYTGGSVSLIGYDLVLTPHSGYYLSELYINGKAVEPAARITLEPDTSCTVRAVFSEIVVEVPWQNTYTDVSEDDWFFSAVKFMDENGIMQGTGNHLFVPHAILSRGMIVTMLHRLEGLPAVSAPHYFSDVQSGMWYSAAVSWAVSAGIVKGYEDGTFRPEQNITREEIAVILRNYALHTGKGSGGLGSLAAFSDSSDVSDWALDSVRWAVGNGIINGRGGGILAPGGTAERCEAAAMLLRCIEK